MNQVFTLMPSAATGPGDLFRCDPLDETDDLLDPRVDGGELPLHLPEVLVNLGEVLVDLLESLVDLRKSLVDLRESLIHLLESLVDLLESPVNLHEVPVELREAPVHPVPERNLVLPERADGAHVRTQLCAYLGHVVIGAGRQHARSLGVGSRNRQLLPHAADLLLQRGHAFWDVILGLSHGAML
ncbi:MAG TPA: hypothetical protein VGE11_14170 [Pseudonocardia sp.]